MGFFALTEVIQVSAIQCLQIVSVLAIFSARRGIRSISSTVKLTPLVSRNLALLKWLTSLFCNEIKWFLSIILQDRWKTQYLSFNPKVIELNNYFVSTYFQDLIRPLFASLLVSTALKCMHCFKHAQMHDLSMFNATSEFNPNILGVRTSS